MVEWWSDPVGEMGIHAGKEGGSINIAAEDGEIRSHLLLLSQLRNTNTSISFFVFVINKSEYGQGWFCRATARNNRWISFFGSSNKFLRNGTVVEDVNSISAAILWSAADSNKKIMCNFSRDSSGAD